MQISSDSVLVFSYYKTDFAVGFKSRKTVNYMTARLFKLCCPLNVVFLVKSGTKLNKRRAKALLAQSQEYQQAVRTQVIASVANLYYTLLMLDAQYEISSETAEKWLETVNTMRAMKEAGMTNEAAVSQAEASYYSIESSLFDLEYQIREMENSLSSLLGEAPRSFERGTLDEQILPENLVVGIPAQMLSNRPDVKNAEYSLAQAFYNTAGARSAFYPALSLSGTLGWTNDGGVTTLDPAKWIFNAAASLVQPIFNAGRNQAQLRIAKAQQQEALLSFQQTLLNAGAEVNNALAKCQSARSKVDLRHRLSMHLRPNHYRVKPIINVQRLGIHVSFVEPY
jgi:outer membrane protein TolC